MPRFRPLYTESLFDPITPDNVHLLIAEMFRPAHFFVASELILEWKHIENEEGVWEIFQGRLLDTKHSRERRSFTAWNIYRVDANDGRSVEPLLAVKLDATAARLYVVRGLDSYVWEGYDAGGNVFESRERRKWVRELAGVLPLERFANIGELCDELACCLFQSVVGASRLPLSSLETPLPEFSLGQLFYCYRPSAPASASSPHGWRELIADMLHPSLNPSEQGHLMEMFLHAAPLMEMPDAAEAFVHRWTEIGRTIDELPALLRTLFNEVSLSPYSDVVEKTLAFLHAGEQRALFPTDFIVDFLSYLLRHVCRHLTAFDLVVFHHRGANYPDVLLLDAAIKEYLAFIERYPHLFFDDEKDGESTRRRKRIRRRALRQGWLLRRCYEGHLVPDSPTSPGENRRVPPPNHSRVPEEQILQSSRRTRRLFDGEPLSSRLGPQAARLLRQSLFDVAHDEEWRELGLALFLDRPFGIGKTAAEPDGTLLLSAEAFSISIARQRLHALARDVDVPAEDADFRRLLAHVDVPGVSVNAIGGEARPGGVSLTDARRSSTDFVFLRSTPSSVRALLAQFDFAPLMTIFRIADVANGSDVLIARSQAGTALMVYDARLRPRLELEIVVENGYESRAGQEYPVGGLRVRQVWDTSLGDDTLRNHDLSGQSVTLAPRRQ